MYKIFRKNNIFEVFQGWRRNMATVLLENFEEEIQEIDESHILTIIEEGGALILVYNNGTYQRFPAIRKNLDAISSIQAKLRKSQLKK